MKSRPCTRALLEQWLDKSGAVRRGDHARVERVDLLSDEQLDAHWTRHGAKATAAFDTYDALSRELDKLVPELTPEMRSVVEARTPERPLLGVVVCSECGEYVIATVGRPWFVDRAMAPSGLAERDVRAVVAVLDECFGADAANVLERLDTDRIREVRALVGEDFDIESVRRHQRATRNARARAPCCSAAGAQAPLARHGWRLGHETFFG